MHLLNNKNRHKLLVIILLTVLISLVVCIYQNNIIEENIKIPTTNSIINTSYDMDTSSIDDGIISITYTGYSKDALVKITKIKDALGNSIKDIIDYNYIINRDSKETFSLTCGNGEYRIGIYENIDDNRYRRIYEEDFRSTNISIDNIFTSSTFYVNYANAGEEFNKLLKLFQNSCMTKEEYIKTAYNWVSKNIDYDNKLANKINRSEISVYRPDISRIVKEKNGICLDSSCIYAALLRANNIPARIVFGYANDVYHAWVEVYMDGKWHLYDTTFSNDSSNTKNILYTINYIY